MTPDASIIWTIIGTVFSALCGLSVFAYRKLYADLEKKVYEHHDELKILTQRLHEVIVAQAEGKAISLAVHELKDELKKIRNDVYQVIRHMPSYRPPSRSQTNE